MGRLRPYAAERHTVLMRTEGNLHKLFKVQFSSSDGSLFVHLPYYRDCDGIAAVATLPAEENPTFEVSLTKCGKVTSRKVKYSHHPDGRALFSQDRRVVSSVRREASPLRGLGGHVFTVQLQGPGDFESVPDEVQARRSSREYDHVLEPRTAADAYKFVGEWVGEERFAEQLAEGDVGPIVLAVDGARSPEVALLLAPESGRPPADRMLLLTCEAMPRFCRDEPSSLLLIGGFDPVERASDPGRETSFLALSYPASDAAKLREEIGTIDFETPVRRGPD